VSIGYLLSTTPVDPFPPRQAAHFQMEQVKLFSSVKERQAYENQADLYSIFVATEYLEKVSAKLD
jgi:hypothetical protein